MTEQQHTEEQNEPIQPEDTGPALLRPEDEEQEQDPVTARNPDPAAASEHERNQQRAAEYGVL